MCGGARPALATEIDVVVRELARTHGPACLGPVRPLV